jgi:hypothetical protein
MPIQAWPVVAAAAASIVAAIFAIPVLADAVVAASVAIEEEPFQGLGELLAVEGVGDEVAPGLGHALEPADGLGRDAGEDLRQGVVREAGHRARAPLEAVHVHATESNLRSGGSRWRCGGMRVRDREKCSDGEASGTYQLPEMVGIDDVVADRRRGRRRGSGNARGIGEFLDPSNVHLCPANSGASGRQEAGHFWKTLGFKGAFCKINLWAGRLGLTP